MRRWPPALGFGTGTHRVLPPKIPHPRSSLHPGDPWGPLAPLGPPQTIPFCPPPASLRNKWAELGARCCYSHAALMRFH